MARLKASFGRTFGRTFGRSLGTMLDLKLGHKKVRFGRISAEISDFVTYLELCLA
jgi:hypothetical protein